MGVEYFKGMGMCSRSVKIAELSQRAWLPSPLGATTLVERLASSSPTQNSAWNAGVGL